MTADLFCNEEQVRLKAGANAPSISSAAYITYISEACAYIDSATRVDFQSTYSTLNSEVKRILQDCAACYAALGVINYDMSGFTSRTEAQTMLDVNWAKVNELIKLLRDKKRTDFISGA